MSSFTFVSLSLNDPLNVSASARSGSLAEERRARGATAKKRWGRNWRACWEMLTPFHSACASVRACVRPDGQGTGLYSLFA